MDDEIIIEEEVKEKPKREKRVKKYLVTNKENRPYEFHIVNDYFRLEPRNKDNDSVELNENQIKSIDFQIALKHVSIKEI
jgi:hypothetical protein